MKVVFLIATLLMASPIRGQATLQISAGGGNLLTGGSFAEGIGVTTYFPNNTVYTGLAARDGHFTVGASDTFMFHETTVVAGDQMIGLNTGNVGLGLALKGVSIHRKRELECNDDPRPVTSRWPGYNGTHCTGGWALTMFSGATGNGVFLPFQQYARPQHLGAGVLAQQRLRDFQFSGLGVLEGGQRTLIGAIEYNFRQRIRATGSGGWLNSQRYAQGQVVLQPFRSVSFYGNHSSYFDPFTATGNSVGASLTIARFTGIAGWNEGTSRGIRTTGQNIGAGFRLKWISEQSTLYKTSKGQTLLVHSVTEMMRRWSFTEAINQSAGRNSYSFGASFRSNRFSISAGHTVQFLLGGRGYAQVLGISVSFRLPHDTTVSASTISNPITGKTLWNVGGEEYIQAGNLILPGHETHSTGKHLIAGHCVLEDGTPQEGCAVVIGKEFVYSNSHGEFQSHQTKKTACVTVPADEFSAPGRWQIVETPNSTAEEGSLIRVVVRKM